MVLFILIYLVFCHCYLSFAFDVGRVLREQGKASQLSKGGTYRLKLFVLFHPIAWQVFGMTVTRLKNIFDKARLSVLSISISGYLGVCITCLSTVCNLQRAHS